MHIKYGFPRLEEPGLLDEDFMQFRIDFLKEELQELIDAYDQKDLPEVIDALIDLTVVAVGTLDLMGCYGQEHWNEVHYANMRKIPVKNAKESKRSFGIDLKKPEDWKGPNHTMVLDRKRS